ncbi:hypothetical protein IGI04_031953 [Brassica rapa subsp. trilocularis]|uniref:NAC domain-containing protein n=1 Tax=Brassica rapa subsp. trilocularis TaxID=1813537 RepID=A0ABQ7LV22_BRACM|nr:hypothetical protein IGI04_031953 [Brassica rapa subsp. trilocularis]
MEKMVDPHPVGFRFHPTDEEIIGYYLREKNMDSFDPWELPLKTTNITEEPLFSKKEDKYNRGGRQSRKKSSAHDKKEEELSHQQRKPTTQLKTPTASLTVNSSAFAENKQSMDSTIKLENRFGLLAENDI